MYCIGAHAITITRLIISHNNILLVEQGDHIILIEKQAFPQYLITKTFDTYLCIHVEYE